MCRRVYTVGVEGGLGDSTEGVRYGVALGGVGIKDCTAFQEQIEERDVRVVH